MSRIGLYLIGALAFTVTVVGCVLLTMADKDTAGLLAITAPVLSAVLVAFRVDSRSDSQDRVIAKIEQNTNGVLNGRIRTQADAAIEAAFLRHGLTKDSTAYFPPEE